MDAEHPSHVIFNYYSKIFLIFAWKTTEGDFTCSCTTGRVCVLSLLLIHAFAECFCSHEEFTSHSAFYNLCEDPVPPAATGLSTVIPGQEGNFRWSFNS
jgi:hypothetical protein